MGYLIVLFSFVIGTAIGSFINAAEWRMYNNGDLVKGRSQCRDCSYVLRVFDLIPIVSFLALSGQCRACKKNISWQYPIVEFVTGITFVLILLHALSWSLTVVGFDALTFGLLLRNWIFVSVLIFLFVYDYKYYLLPDTVTLPAIVFALVSNLGFYWIGGLEMYHWKYMLAGALIGSGFFYLQYIISSGKWVGGGDIRMGGLMGVMLGYPLILLALFSAYILGSLVSVPLLLRKHKGMKDIIPFGTFLALGAFIALIWGKPIIEWYVSLIV